MPLYQWGNANETFLLGFLHPEQTKKKKQKQSSLGVLGYIWVAIKSGPLKICKGVPKILLLDQICLLSMQIKAREVGD